MSCKNRPTVTLAGEAAECLRELTGFIFVVSPSNKTRFPLSDLSDFPAFKLANVSMTSEEDGRRVKTVCVRPRVVRGKIYHLELRVRQRKGGKFSHLGSWNDPNYCDYGKHFGVSLLLCENDKV